MVLANQGKFDEILARLGRLENHSHHGSADICRLGSLYINDAAQAAFPLHALLRHRPTVAVVDALIHRLQHDMSSLAPGMLVPEECRETLLQQTPLHVAVASQCSVAVLERLLQGESLVMPAMAKDSLHRFPLHWACCAVKNKNASGISPFKPWKRRAFEADYRWDVVHLLLHQYPVAAVIPDVYQQTPLDYARHNRLDAAVVELLEEAAAEYERYAPPRGGKAQLREHTEATSIESELVPDELPTVISPTKQAGTSNMSKWFASQADDEVSSLGGDFPSHFSLEGTKTMAQVTSLFSSALSFTGQPKDIHNIHNETIVCNNDEKT